MNKYIISGNKSKNMVSLIFIVSGNTNIDKVLSIVENKDVKVNFFVDGSWVEKK